MTKAVFNSSVIIALSTLGYLNKIKPLFDSVIIAKAVYEEISIAGEGLIGEKELKEATKTPLFQVKTPKNQILVTALLEPLAKGEAETIAIALEEKTDYIVLDDKAARRKAKAMKLNVIGSLRVLRMMYDNKIISKTNFISALKKLSETGFRITPETIDKVAHNL